MAESEGAEMKQHKIEEIEAQLIEQQGNLSAAARKLGMSRRGVQKRVEKSPQLQEVLEDARETMVDDAENVLRDKLKAGDLAAAMFIAKTLGKNRGYVERTEEDRMGGMSIRVTYENRNDQANEDAPSASRDIDGG
jgi:hypothetical protein